MARPHLAETFPADVFGMVLVDAGAEDPLRVLPGGKVTHASELAKGQALPPVKTSGPLRESDLPPRIVSLIQSGVRGMAGHFNDSPRDKLPPASRSMREWSLSQIKHAPSSYNPFEADELAAMLAERKKRQNVLGDLPLVVISRGLPDEDGPQATPREGPSKGSGGACDTFQRGQADRRREERHHVPLDEPGVVASAVREIVPIVCH